MNKRFRHHPHQNPPPTNALRIIPLGGVGTVTKQMFAYIYGDDMLVVDCGIGFGGQDLFGVDFSIPDCAPLRSMRKKLHAYLLTHAHEDHIGALPFILPELPAPIYGTPFTVAMVQERLREKRIPHQAISMQLRQPYHFGAFTVEAVHMTHSVPDAAALRISCPAATVVHAADFKFDWTPVDGLPSDAARLGQFGEEGVDVLLSDCLRAEKKGTTLSERSIEETFESELLKTRGKFLMTTASSNISRIQQAVDVALRNGRKISFVGRSIERTVLVAQRLGMLHLPSHAVVDADAISSMRPENIVAIVSGSQGQIGSALERIALGKHQIKVTADDTVVFSADPIPGSEVAVHRVIDLFSRRRARVLYSDILDDLHVSGHGAQTDLALMVGLTRPYAVLPIGGDYRHMDHYASLVRQMGYEEHQILMIAEGQPILVGRHRIHLDKPIPVRQVMVDAFGEKTEVNVVHDRQLLAAEGMLIVVVTIDVAAKELVGHPDFLPRGLTLPDETKVYTGAEGVIRTLVHAISAVDLRDGHALREEIENAMAEYIFKVAKKRPLIVPVLVEV
ncbi:MAG: ribonuclease J [bacterium]|nr:ribonuclease J [bacterium]